MDAATGALLLVFTALVAVVIQQGLAALSGAAGKQRLRPRPAGATPEQWLLGPRHAAATAAAGTGTASHPRLPGLQVSCGPSAAAVSAWSADEPPPLSAEGPSHLWGLLPRTWPFSDIVIRPEPVEISAPVEVVWEAVLDFDAYSEWKYAQHPTPSQPDFQG